MRVWKIPRDFTPTVLLLGFLMGVTTDPSPTLAEDPVPINTIYEDPDDYHLVNVLLQGTARQVKALDPYTIPSGESCYGAYTFSLEDESGEIPVWVLGICGTPLLRLPPFSDGERLSVRAHIHAPGHLGYLKDVMGQRIPDWPPTTVQAIASQINKAPE